MSKILNRLKQLLSSISLKRKFLSIVLTSIILIASASLVGIYMVAASYQRLLHDTVASNLSYSATTLSFYLDNAETMSGLLLADNAIQRSLSDVKYNNSLRIRTEAYKTLSYTLSEYYQQYKPYYLNYLTLITPDFITYSDFFTSQKTPNAIHNIISKKVKAGDGRPVWISDYSSEYGLFMGRLIKSIQSSTLENLGTLIVSVDLTHLMESLNKEDSIYQDAQYYISADNSIIYNENPITLAIQEKMDANNSIFQIITIEQHKYFIVMEKLNKFGWNYVCYISYSRIFETVHFVTSISISVIVLGILIAILFSESMISFITWHTNRLIEKMEAFSTNEKIGFEHSYDYSSRKDEFGMLNRHFDRMTEKIYHLIQVNYINELWKKDARLKALEMQINPHFLYNTLESINWRAKIAGNHAVSAMVKSLGLLLRSTLSDSSSTFTLKKELDVVEAYMTIQTYRFEDRLTYHTSYDKSLIDAKIPKMSIQPLVENAINYGLEESTDFCSITILILLNEEANTLTISVENNGSEFEDDILEKLRSEQVIPHGFGIGLINIDERIKIMFGREFGLRLFNKHNHAVAEMTFPYIVD